MRVWALWRAHRTNGQSRTVTGISGSGWRALVVIWRQGGERLYKTMWSVSGV